MELIITLQDYLDKGKAFVIPEYQRGYIWGKNRKGERNSVESILQNLQQHYKSRTEIFLQGITVTETENEIVLIDGQQRTTFLYLLLKTLGYTGKFQIQYQVREESNDFLTKEWGNDEEIWKENPLEEYQDLYFFKKSIRIINEYCKNIENKEDFLEFSLSHIRFLYIKIPADKATMVFTMMNGNKAKMLQEEVVKAEILRLISLNSDESDWNKEWENNMIRSRYAREWDRWLHWWRREDVCLMFRNKSPMGLLLSSYAQMQKCKEFTFEEFKIKLLSNSNILEAKRVFDGLRRLQKRFEDAYNDPARYNMIGAIFCIFNTDNRNKFIQYFFVEDHLHCKEDDIKLEDYYLLAFIGMSHDEIINNDKSKFIEKCQEKYSQSLTLLYDDMLYMVDECKEYAFRFLLRLNVDEDTKQGRKFNFSIWGSNVRSLEHIYPKSKVLHQEEDNEWYNGNNDPKTDNSWDGYLKRMDIKDDVTCTTEHSIGNIVLLYKDENSMFNNNDFATKKELFFSPNRKGLFKSRHLLHTICVFAEKEKWDGKSIAKNKCATLNRFRKDYQKYIVE